MESLTRRRILTGGIALAVTSATVSRIAASPGSGSRQPRAGQVEPSPAAAGLEVVATLHQRPGGIALTPDGRLLVSRHPFPYGKPSAHRIVEVLPDGTITPFPNETWSGATSPGGVGLDAVLGIEADQDGVVWMLDMGRAGGALPKILAWDTRRSQLARVVYVPSFAASGRSRLNRARSSARGPHGWSGNNRPRAVASAKPPRPPASRLRSPWRAGMANDES